MIDSEFEKIYLQRDRRLQLFFYGYSFDGLTVRLSIIENYTLLSLIFVSLLEKVVVFSYAIFHSFFWLLIRAVRSLSGAEVTPRLRSVSELI